MIPSFGVHIVAKTLDVLWTGPILDIIVAPGSRAPLARFTHDTFHNANGFRAVVKLHWKS